MQEIFCTNKIPGSVVRTTREWVHSDHATAAGLIIDHQRADGSCVKQAGPVAWLSEPSLPTSQPQRQDTRARAAQAMPEKGLWLRGTKALDQTVTRIRMLHAHATYARYMRTLPTFYEGARSIQRDCGPDDRWDACALRCGCDQIGRRHRRARTSSPPLCMGVPTRRTSNPSLCVGALTRVVVRSRRLRMCGRFPYVWRCDLHVCGRSPD